MVLSAVREECAMSNVDQANRQYVSHPDTTSFAPNSIQNSRCDEATFTLRSVLVGVAVGLMVCCANLYLGLSAGLVNSMTIPSALIGFAVFKLVSSRLKTPFTPGENVLVQTVSSSLGNMPVTSGQNGVIPALEYLIGPDKNGPLRFSSSQLLIWSLGSSLLGVVFAVALRKQSILRRPLRFPTGTASAVLIGTLHDRSNIIETIKKDRELPDEASPRAANSIDVVQQEQMSNDDQAEDYASQTHAGRSARNGEDTSVVGERAQSLFWRCRASAPAFVASAIFVSTINFKVSREASGLMQIDTVLLFHTAVPDRSFVRYVGISQLGMVGESKTCLCWVWHDHGSYHHSLGHGRCRIGLGRFSKFFLPPSQDLPPVLLGLASPAPPIF